MLSEVILYSCCWYFEGSWNGIGVLHWQWVLMSVAVVLESVFDMASVLYRTEQRDMMSAQTAEVEATTWQTQTFASHLELSHSGNFEIPLCYYDLCQFLCALFSCTSSIALRLSAAKRVIPSRSAQLRSQCSLACCLRPGK
jgi:hypothetical protein